MTENNWDVIVDADNRRGRANFKKIWQYRDLLVLLVRRDFVSFYKQTILGPLWFFIKPIFSAAVYLFVFGKLAGLSTDGIPPVLFYISGVTIWSYFTETVSMTSNVLIGNAAIFGKVYFPRMIMPLSIIFSNLVKLSIQILLIISLLIYFAFTDDQVDIGPQLVIAPFIVLIVASQAFGLGLIVASISTKYRDLSMLIGYALQLGLFITPIVYPLSSISGKFKFFASANPMTFPVELFRYSFFGTGTYSSLGIVYMVVVSAVLVVLGVYSFNKAEKTFVDIV